MFTFILTKTWESGSVPQYFCYPLQTIQLQDISNHYVCMYPPKFQTITMYIYIYIYVCVCVCVSYSFL